MARSRTCSPNCSSTCGLKPQRASCFYQHALQFAGWVVHVIGRIAKVVAGLRSMRRKAAAVLGSDPFDRFVIAMLPAHNGANVARGCCPLNQIDEGESEVRVPVAWDLDENMCGTGHGPIMSQARPGLFATHYAGAKSARII